ncbi:Transmembrane protein [Sesbania bispinosa]|nr:Transmembrane protein [Sesbania bispinosa]
MMENSFEAGASDKPPHKPPDGGGATANAKNGNVGENTGVDDFHGDWMLVSRNKRSQKSRSFKNGNNDEHILNSRTKSGGIEDKNSFGTLQGGIKFVHNNPKDSKCVSQGDQAGPILKSTKDHSGSAYDDVRKTSAALNSFPFGINTSMQVEVVAPNHLRLLDENDPPNPGQVSGMIVEGHEQQIGDQSEVDMEESTSDEEDEVEMVGETQSVHG